MLTRRPSQRSKSSLTRNLGKPDVKLGIFLFLKEDGGVDEGGRSITFNCGIVNLAFIVIKMLFSFTSFFSEFRLREREN